MEWSDITQPLLSRGFTHYSCIKIRVGKQKEQVWGSPSHFVDSAGGWYEKNCDSGGGYPQKFGNSGGG